MPSPSWLLRAALFAALLLSVFALPAVAKAAPGDIGFEGPSTVGAGAAPSGSKPESKLWWNDGSWWGSLWHRASGDFHIFRLDQGTQTWVDTGVALDDRPSTRADTLWDAAAGKLYVASHRFSESPASGYPSRLYRYSYNPSTDTYTRDPGFPVTINNFRTETLVIDKDSTGQLWATWVQGGKVWVRATICNPACNDASWGTTLAMPTPAVKSDDISSVIAFGGNRIGIMWSNQNNWTFGFAIHDNSWEDNVWSLETALSGNQLSDDHINLKSDSSGRVYAAIKTSKSSSSQPLTMLLVRQAGGSWSSHVYGTVGNDHTRPIVELDEEHGVIHMYATDSGSGGSIMEKTTPMDSISFATGKGKPVITDADGKVNNATSTKQNLSSATGLVVVSHSSNGHYMHSFQPLGGGGGGTAPSASFTASPTSGVAPLTVQFTDTSTGTVDSRAWDFQNDGIVDSTAASPTFTYMSANTYTAKLTVTNTFGSTSTTRTITVDPPGGGGSSLTFTPTDDAFVRWASPDANNGTATTLRVYKTGDQSYLKFTVSGVTGPVSSVKLRLWVIDASNAAGNVYAVSDTTWSESTITWANRPPGPDLLATGGAAPLGTWVDFDLTGAVTGNGTYSFLLKNGSADLARYHSKEAANDPRLVVTFGS